MKLTSRLLLGKMLSKLESCDKEIAEMYDMMVETSAYIRPQIEIIDSIPSLGELSAIYIIAEIGTDLSSFPTANHFTAWAGLAPKDNKSADKLKSSKTQKANIYIRSVLTECAWAATRTRNTRLSNWYWTNVKRLGEKKAITAVARKLLVYIYSMLKSGELYDDSLDVADNQKRKAQKLESAHKTVAHQSCSPKTQKHSADNIASNLVIATTDGMSQDVITCVKTKTVSKDVAESEPLKRKRGRPRKTEATEKQLISHMV
jgi:hypothetical protein